MHDLWKHDQTKRNYEDLYVSYKWNKIHMNNSHDMFW
jgi:hypothetical protein